MQCGKFGLYKGKILGIAFSAGSKAGIRRLRAAVKINAVFLRRQRAAAWHMENIRIFVAYIYRLLNGLYCRVGIGVLISPGGEAEKLSVAFADNSALHIGAEKLNVSITQTAQHRFGRMPIGIVCAAGDNGIVRLCFV